MDEIKAELYGFDFRGPASSEALNEFLENISEDMGVLIQNTHNLRNDCNLLGGQTLKQTLALCKKYSELSDSARDSGNNCKADLSDSTVLLTTDRNGSSILSADRLVHRQEMASIAPPVTSFNWIARPTGSIKTSIEGVTYSSQAATETGTVFSTPMYLAYSGMDSIFYERQLVANAPQGTPQGVSLFYGIPVVRNGTGYPNTNYLSLIPFPLYTPGLRIWYTTDSEPTLTRAGSTWYAWPDYVDNLYHNGTTFSDEAGPLYASFPTTNITAVRIDIQQSFYLVEQSNYVYTYGLGGLEIGLAKPNTTTAKGTVKITKPSGNFVTVATDGGNVLFSNIPSADYDDIVSTYSWIDPGDATIAYVEITILPNEATDGQIPIIKEVSVDYV